MPKAQKTLLKAIKVLFILVFTLSLSSCGASDKLSDMNGEQDILSADAALRAVAGTIASNGNVLDGTDFQASVIEQNTFLIRYEAPFTEAPTVEINDLGDASVLMISKLESVQVLIVPFFDEPYTFTFSAIGF